MTLARPTRLAGAWTSVVSKWYANDIPQPYAHWLLDALPRLALLGEFPAETKIILPGWKRKYHVDALQMLGLAERCRWTPEKHLIVEDYYFSSPTTMVVCHNPYAVKFLRTNFLPKAPAAETPRKFFLRRTSFGRNMVNEEEVYRFFKEHGWAIVDAAGLSFLEQIQYFSNAEAVCAIHGSGTANMVWCEAGCKFVELFAADYLAGDQEWIAQCVDVDYSFMMFPSDHKLSAEVNVGELKEHLVARGMLEC
jgi:capsular polysaccharide biosynthesis protein